MGGGGTVCGKCFACAGAFGSLCAHLLYIDYGYFGMSDVPSMFTPDDGDPLRILS